MSYFEHLKNVVFWQILFFNNRILRRWEIIKIEVWCYKVLLDSVSLYLHLIILTSGFGTRNTWVQISELLQLSNCKLGQIPWSF